MLRLPSLKEDKSCVAMSRDSLSTAVSFPLPFAYLARPANKSSSIRHFTGKSARLLINGFRPLPYLMAPAFYKKTPILKLPPLLNNAFNINLYLSTSITNISFLDRGLSFNNVIFNRPIILPLLYIHFLKAKLPLAEFFIYLI